MRFLIKHELMRKMSEAEPNGACPSVHTLHSDVMDDATPDIKSLDPDLYDAEVLLGLLHEYRGPLGENKGMFYSTFKRYALLNDHQRSKTQEWLSKLPVDERKALLEATLSKTALKRHEDAAKLTSKNVRVNKSGSQLSSLNRSPSV